MPIRIARDDDFAYISNLDMMLATEGGAYPHEKSLFSNYLDQRLNPNAPTSAVVIDLLAERDTKFYLIQTANRDNAGFLVTSDWTSTDEASRNALLSKSDLRLWFVGVEKRFRRQGLAQEAIQHVLDENLAKRLEKDRYAAAKHGTRKFAAKVPLSAHIVMALLQDRFNFEPAPGPADPVIFACPI